MYCCLLGHMDNSFWNFNMTGFSVCAFCVITSLCRGYTIFYLTGEVALLHDIKVHHKHAIPLVSSLCHYSYRKNVYASIILLMFTSFFLSHNSKERWTNTDHYTKRRRKIAVFLKHKSLLITAYRYLCHFILKEFAFKSCVVAALVQMLFQCCNVSVICRLTLVAIEPRSLFVLISRRLAACLGRMFLHLSTAAEAEAQ